MVMGETGMERFLQPGGLRGKTFDGTGQVIIKR